MQAVAAVSGGDAALAAAGPRVPGGHCSGGRVRTAGQPRRHLGAAARRWPSQPSGQRRHEARGRGGTVIHPTLTQNGLAHRGFQASVSGRQCRQQGGARSHWQQQQVPAADSTQRSQQCYLTASAGSVSMQMWHPPADAGYKAGQSWRAQGSCDACEGAHLCACGSHDQGCFVSTATCALNRGQCLTPHNYQLVVAPPQTYRRQALN